MSRGRSGGVGHLSQSAHDFPSRKLKFSCPKCNFRNEVGSKYCNQCGVTLPPIKEEDSASDAKAEHRDIAHPITQEFREYLQSKILNVYKKEAGAAASE